MAVYKDGDKWRVIYRYSNFKGERKIAEIEPRDVIAWQNEMLAYEGENGEVYCQTYLKTIHAQLSAIFNHAVGHEYAVKLVGEELMGIVLYILLKN